MDIRLEPRRNGRYVHPSGSRVATTDLASKPAFGHVRRPPLFTFDPAGVGYGVHVAAPRTIARAPLLCHHVQDARHIGFRLVVAEDGWIAFDEALDNEVACENQMRRFSNTEMTYQREDTDVALVEGKYISRRLDDVDIYVKGVTFSLLSDEPSNYGSWLFRILPKLAIAAQLELQDFKVACWSPRPFQRELLRFFGIEASRLVDILVSKTYHYELLHVPTCPNPHAYLNEMTLEFVRQALERNGIKRERVKCIYISRSSHAKKKGLTNVRYFKDEDRLVERLLRAGFQIVEPETLTVFEQIRLFSSAAMVVGASGAAMFNTIFCEPGTFIVDIESLPYWLYAHANYFSSLGHAYVMAFGTSDPDDGSGPHRSWTIDVDKVSDLIVRIRDLLAYPHLPIEARSAGISG